MKAVLISDLHLEENRPDITQAFVHFCEKLPEDVTHFFILGDLFEVWIGDDYETDFIKYIKKLLKSVSSRIEHCFFQHGNRDFLIGEQFSQETGFQILEEQYSFRYQEINYLLMHGDSLCTLDTEYMQARLLLRSQGFQQNVLSRSVEERLALAQQMRATSMNANSEKSMDIMDVTPEEVIKVMEARNAVVFIHGHTHRPNIHELNLHQNHKAKRIVMSDWEKDIQFATIDENGVELRTFAKT